MEQVIQSNHQTKQRSEVELRRVVRRFESKWQRKATRSNWVVQTQMALFGKLVS